MPEADEPSSSGIGTYRPAEPPSRYDPAPGLNKEKMLLLGVFVLKSVITVSIHSSNAGWGYAVPFLVQDAIWLGLLLLALFIPFVPLKRGCVGCSGCIALFFFIIPFTMPLMVPGIADANWILSTIGIIGFMLMMVRGSCILLMEYLSWIGVLLNVGVYLWLVSVLYRDIRWCKRQGRDRV
jgi:hypothetical protein